MRRDFDNVADFVGVPWAADADGPDAFDCWQLVRAAAHAAYGLEFPRLLYDANTVDVAARDQMAGGHWQRIDAPEPGAVLAMTDSTGAVTHVGLCVGAGRVLHSQRTGAGACLQRVEALRLFYGFAGFYQWRP